ncbi:MAG: ATP-binding protein [Anaerotignum sp.]|nr:ATP-binding protein [Anaerotignum sp.]
MEITTGKLNSAQKVVVYGPEGIGKSTFLAQFPGVLFIDTEGSTKHMDVARLPKPSSFTMLLEEVRYVKSNPHICKTLAIDTVDWAEQLCVEDICARHNKMGIEDFGYGNGYVYTKEEFGRFLNLLEDVVDLGIHVVLAAHAQIRKFEQPDEMGAYDRYELKLGKKTSSQTSPLVKEWADMVLFANYKTYSIATDKDGKKHKAQGGERVMHTVHHPCWDAKNRHGLPAEMPFEYSLIAHCFMVDNSATVAQPMATQPREVSQMPPMQQMQLSQKIMVQEQPKQSDAPAQASENAFHPISESEARGNPFAAGELAGLPKALQDLMAPNYVTCGEIQEVVAARGYFPLDVPVEKYDEYQPGFVSGVLVAAWPQVFEMIKQNRKKVDEIPY